MFFIFQIEQTNANQIRSNIILSLASKYTQTYELMTWSIATLEKSTPITCQHKMKLHILAKFEQSKNKYCSVSSSPLYQNTNYHSNAASRLYKVHFIFNIMATQVARHEVD